MVLTLPVLCPLFFHIYTLPLKFTFQEKLKWEKKRSLYEVIVSAVDLLDVLRGTGKPMQVGLVVSLVKWQVSVKLSALRPLQMTCEDLVIDFFSVDFLTQPWLQVNVGNIKVS